VLIHAAPHIVLRAVFVDLANSSRAAGRTNVRAVTSQCEQRADIVVITVIGDIDHRTTFKHASPSVVMALLSPAILDETRKGREPQHDRSYQIQGLKSFLYTPSGRLPALAAEQVVSGLSFLCELQETCRNKSDVVQCAAPSVRSRLNWSWGKHAVALALRAPWGWRSRIEMLRLGTRCLLWSIWIASMGRRGV
jgi:hypothetical protein